MSFLKLKGGQEVTSLLNYDIVPMPLSRRVWGFWSYVSFFAMGNISVTTWSAASSVLSLGLSVGEGMGCIIIGNLFISTAYYFASAPGYDFHVGYTVLQRVLFGIRGCYLGVVIRIILSIVWYGSYAWMGGVLLGNIISSWSSNYLNLPNNFPEGIEMSRKDLIGFVLFQLIQLPFFYFKPERLNILVHAGVLCTFFAMLGLTIWAVVYNNGNNGPLMSVTSPEISSSSAHGWAWIYGITSWFGSILTSIVNAADYTRFTKKHHSSWGGMYIGNLVMGTIIPLMGLVTTSALKDKYQEELWNPPQILDRILTDNYTPKARAGVFFCALGLLMSQLSVNVMGNGIAGGSDLAGLVPKYINIRRGAIITALLSWVVCPWRFYNTSSTFLTVMSSFSVFLSPLAGIIICEHWVKRRRSIKVSDLYTADPSGDYYYIAGVNWQNMLWWVIGFAPGIPGLVNSANPNITVNNGIINYYQGSSLFGFCIAFFLCYISGFVFKDTHARDIDDKDYYGTFTEEEANKLNIIPYDEGSKELFA